MPESTATVLLFLKAPLKGLVKTRLARDLGDDEALRIYRQLVERQISFIPENWKKEVFYHGSEDDSVMAEWLGPDCDYYKQVDGDLGRKMECAFDDAFGRADSPCIGIGGDCPYLNETVLLSALKALQGNDSVFGPATDGGYYLVGMAKNLPKVFQEVPWSADNTLEVTLQNIQSLAYTYQLIEELEDVDDLDSWERANKLF